MANVFIQIPSCCLRCRCTLLFWKTRSEFSFSDKTRGEKKKKHLQLNPEQKSVLQTTLCSSWYLLKHEDDRQLEWMCGLCYIYTYFRPFGCQPTARWFILLNLPYFLMALGTDDWVYAVLWVHSSYGVTHTVRDVRHISQCLSALMHWFAKFWNLFWPKESNVPLQMSQFHLRALSCARALITRADYFSAYKKQTHSLSNRSRGQDTRVPADI